MPEQLIDAEESRKRDTLLGQGHKILLHSSIQKFHLCQGVRRISNAKDLQDEAESRTSSLQGLFWFHRQRQFLMGGKCKSDYLLGQREKLLQSL